MNRGAKEEPCAAFEDCGRWSAVCYIYPLREAFYKRQTTTEENANTLFIYSNTNWELSFAVTDNGSDHLSVLLSSDEGEDDAEITVGYTLNDLRSMDAGDYTVTVTYTVTAI